MPARRFLGLLHAAALRKLLLTAALTNAVLSATEVALIAYARHQHALWASGPLLAGVSLGSILGSLVLGAQPLTTSQGHDRPPNRLVRLLTGHACGLAVLTAAGLFPPLLGADRAHEPRPVRVQERDGTEARRTLGRGGRPAPTGGQAMSSWTAQRVLDAAAAMEWVPEGAIELRTDDYHLIRYPDVVLDPTFRAAQVTWSRTARALEEILDEVAVHIRAWGLPGVAWWVSAATRPADTEQALCARGAELIDAVQVLAREIGGGLPQLDVPPDVVVELVRDERTFRAASAVTVQGWERAEPDEVELASQLDEAIGDLATWSSFQVVALMGRQPVSTGGCSLAGEVAQLWGAVTLLAARGRGSYRAVLTERLRLAREHGATLALVKGRVLTSAPILLRAGFADYGEERCYWLPVG